MYPDTHYADHLHTRPAGRTLDLVLLMNKITSLALFVAGLVLLVFGLNSADSVSSSVSEAVTGAPTDKSIWLIVLGIIGLLSGGAGFLFGRRSH